MTNEQIDISLNICKVAFALSALIEYAELIIPEDKTKLSRLYIQFGDLLSKIVEVET